jgi:hypothetical protein
MRDPRTQEFEGLLEDLSYAITSARTTGLDEAERLRVIARQIRDISSNIDSLAGSIVAEKMAAEDG